MFDMEGEWTCLAEIWLDEELSDTCLAAGLVDSSFVCILRKLGVKIIHNFCQCGDAFLAYLAVLG